MNLEDSRARIDTIDDAIADLLAERMRAVRDVAAYKAQSGTPVTDPARERAVLSRAAERVGPELEMAAKRVFETLMDVSRAQQRETLGVESLLTTKVRAAMASGATLPTRVVVACQGTEGSYQQQACDALFPFASILYFEDFASVFQAVEKGLCQFGVLPIENSWAGSVTEVYDLLASRSCMIARAIRRPIDHVLLAPSGVKLQDIKRVYSHPQALAQCANWIKNHSGIEPIPLVNTAVAAKRVQNSTAGDEAAIASGVCAQLYGLEPIAYDIANSASNSTRFLCLSRDLLVTPDANRISMILQLPHKPGSLYALMSRFASMGLNLTKLESRLIPGSDFQFRFHLDLEADARDPRVPNLLGDLERSAERMQLLGFYREL
ncbi:bifunctional chorismate mutase/prephenate dehydratase [Clostridia bacterium]|nr:bifunctional chorismate mutase/prephenate dehydratase [Clostridia bacterium]